MFKWYEIEFSGRYTRLAESPEDALQDLQMDDCGYPDIRERTDDDLTDDERNELEEANYECPDCGENGIDCACEQEVDEHDS